jgi:hypothetical protein
VENVDRAAERVKTSQMVVAEKERPSVEFLAGEYPPEVNGSKRRLRVSVQKARVLNQLGQASVETYAGA